MMWYEEQWERRKDEAIKRHRAEDELRRAGGERRRQQERMSTSRSNACVTLALDKSEPEASRRHKESEAAGGSKAERQRAKKERRLQRVDQKRAAAEAEVGASEPETALTSITLSALCLMS